MALRLLGAVMWATAALLFPAAWWVKLGFVLVAWLSTGVAVTRWTPRSART